MVNEKENELIKSSKYNAFMGTIAICVVYAIFAVALILFATFTEQGKSLYKDLKPFASVVIFGTIVIIVVMTILVINWKPEEAKKTTLDDIENNSMSCPDYYKLNELDDKVPVDKNEKKDILGWNHYLDRVKYADDSEGTDVILSDYKIDSSKKHLIKYRCEMNNDIIKDNSDFNGTGTNLKGVISDLTELDNQVGNLAGNTNTWNSSDSVNNKNDYKALSAFTAMYGGIGYDNSDDPANYQFTDSSTSTSTSNDKIRKYDDNYKPDNGNETYTFSGYDCTKVYPEYLAYLDAKEYLKNDENGPKNLHRCEWSKKCGVPWTEAGCE
jgi:hypothetical protein